MKTRSYSYYIAGRWNGKGPVLVMIRYYREDGSFGSCQVVEESAFAAEVAALRKLGYVNQAKV